MAVKNKVKVRIRCVVDLPVGTWGDNDNIAYLAERARIEGTELLQRMVTQFNGSLYGTPKALIIVCEEE